MSTPNLKKDQKKARVGRGHILPGLTWSKAWGLAVASKSTSRAL